MAIISIRAARIMSVLGGAAGALLLAACAMVPSDYGYNPAGGTQPPPPPPEAPRRLMATVRAADGDAFIIPEGSATELRAKTGDQLYENDRFYTRNGWMKLAPATGGEIIVYPDTDPRLFWDVACFTVGFFDRGEVKITADKACVNGRVQQGSTVGYQAQGGLLTVWVLEGHARLMRRGLLAISAGQRAVIQDGRILSITPFTPEEFRSEFPDPAAPIIL